jgi:hypothetical protein
MSARHGGLYEKNNNTQLRKVCAYSVRPGRKSHLGVKHRYSWIGSSPPNTVSTHYSVPLAGAAAYNKRIPARGANPQSTTHIWLYIHGWMFSFWLGRSIFDSAYRGSSVICVLMCLFLQQLHCMVVFVWQMIIFNIMVLIVLFHMEGFGGDTTHAC